MLPVSTPGHFAGLGFGSPNVTLPSQIINLGAYVRDGYMLRFREQVAAGNAKPLILPYALLGSFILPVLYLSIPHVNRPWLYRARYLLMAFIVVFNMSEVASSGSANVAVAYMVGLMQAWGVMWNMTLLVWMRPQFEAERVERRWKGRGGMADGMVKDDGNGYSMSRVNRNANGKNSSKEGQTTAKTQDAPDKDIAKSLEEGYEYYWQAFPADAPFTTRLGWATDLVCAFRGSGWNWAVPTIPRFAKPEKPLSGELVELSSIPIVTRIGYRRFATSAEFLRSKMLVFVLSYAVLDTWSVFAVKDPYFVLGPEHGQPLPHILARMPSWLLSLSRSSVALVGIFIALHTVFILWQLMCHFLFRRMLGARSELWHLASINGSFNMVMDKGLAGFWGGWWHQTFRVAFSAPTNWLVRKGWLDVRSNRGKVVASFIAFAQSGFLHTVGSITCLPPTKPWMPPLFFLSSWVGILVQQSLCQVLRKPMIEKCPVWVRRSGNLVYVMVWMHLSQWLFVDDISRSAVWLFEPVPVSPLRALGLGKPGDSWWRWDFATVGIQPSWYSGEHWWESGVAI